MAQKIVVRFHSPGQRNKTAESSRSGLNGEPIGVVIRWSDIMHYEYWVRVNGDECSKGAMSTCNARVVGSIPTVSTKDGEQNDT